MWRQIGIRAAYHPDEYCLFAYPQLRFPPGNRATLKKRGMYHAKKIFPVLLANFEPTLQVMLLIY